MTKKPAHKDRGGMPPTPVRVPPARARGDDAEIVIDIEYTTPGTALDDHLRKEQTRALLNLLADYVQKRDKGGDTGP
jgi:hypothetical protein